MSFTTVTGDMNVALLSCRIRLYRQLNRRFLLLLIFQK